MGAKSAIQHNPKMKADYQNTMAKDKNKKSASNMIRTELLARVFEPLKKGMTYRSTMK